MTTFFLTACEPSGDRLGAAIIQSLREKLPKAKFIGVAGPLMRAAGCEVFLPQESLAVMGFVEVLKQLPKLLKARKHVVAEALRVKPDIYIGIDAPDFNLFVETKLKAQGIKTVHVNSPTIWAWRAGRIKKIQRAVDLMLVLFPFETKIYQEHHIPVAYIGHPLADEIPLDSKKALARRALGIPETTKVLALMPGSRSAEIKHLAPVFLAAAKICQAKIPGLKILVPMVSEARATQFEDFVTPHPLNSLREFHDQCFGTSYASGAARALRDKIGNPADFSHKGRGDITISIGNAHQVLQAADAVLIASGTATLEAMLCKTPMVVAYKADALSFWIARKLVKIPHVSLPNILAGKAIVPEFLQEHATKENLAEACLKMLTEKNVERDQSFHALHKILQQHAAEKAADAIISMH